MLVHGRFTLAPAYLFGEAVSTLYLSAKKCGGKGGEIEPPFVCFYLVEPPKGGKRKKEGLSVRKLCMVVGLTVGFLLTAQAVGFVQETIASHEVEGVRCHPYVTEQGDTLSSLAKRSYKNEAKQPIIYLTNPGVIGEDPDRLQPGQLLCIPNEEDIVRYLRHFKDLLE